MPTAAGGEILGSEMVPPTFIMILLHIFAGGKMLTLDL